jgi:hypothetical protein
MPVHDYLADVPARFYQDAESNKLCMTVADLIAELQLLPPDLRVAQGLGDGARVEVGCAMKEHGDPEDAYVETM